MKDKSSKYVLWLSSPFSCDDFDMQNQPQFRKKGSFRIAKAMVVIMTLDYKTKGTCSRKILLTIEDGIIKNVAFEGGCNGNLKGISSLVVGRDALEVAKSLEGTDCNGRGTSCPDQLAKAIREALSAS